MASYSIINIAQEKDSQVFGTGILMAMLYVEYDIKNAGDLTVYIMDYIMYGVVYDMLGWDTTFTEINFFPSDLMCYVYNKYDDDAATSTVPSKNTSGYETNTGFYVWMLDTNYPT